MKEQFAVTAQAGVCRRQQLETAREGQRDLRQEDGIHLLPIT